MGLYNLLGHARFICVPMGSPYTLNSALHEHGVHLYAVRYLSLQLYHLELCAYQS